MSEKKIKSAKIVAIQNFDKVAVATCNNETYLFWKQANMDDLLVFKQIKWKDCIIKIRRDDKDSFFDICRIINENIS